MLLLLLVPLVPLVCLAVPVVLLVRVVVMLHDGSTPFDVPVGARAGPPRWETIYPLGVFRYS
ncbi:hypothetical protein GCM10010385_42490 [Streptomyces geysiriensis]|nr:hypothetical protein GCM10010385_42490 [Streptomyces geysiriensis]